MDIWYFDNSFILHRAAREGDHMVGGTRIVVNYTTNSTMGLAYIEIVLQTCSTSAAQFYTFTHSGKKFFNLPNFQEIVIPTSRACKVSRLPRYLGLDTFPVHAASPHRQIKCLSLDSRQCEMTGRPQHEGFPADPITSTRRA